MGKLAAPFLALLAVLTTAVCADAARIRLPRPKRGLQMRMGKFTIPAAREREVCEFRTLPNRKSIDAQEFEFEMTPGSHHDEMCFIVGYYYRGDDRALSRPPGRDRLRSPRLAAARAPSPISLSGA